MRKTLSQAFAIGTINTIDPFTSTRRYETASWFTKREVEPDEYPVFMRIDPNDGYAKYWFEANGAVIDHNTQSEYFGAAIGKNRNSEEIGKLESVVVNLKYPFIEFVSDNQSHKATVNITAPFASLGASNVDLDKQHPAYQQALEIEFVQLVKKKR